jgi:hypothetical protein
MKVSGLTTFLETVTNFVRRLSADDVDTKI